MQRGHLNTSSFHHIPSGLIIERWGVELLLWPPLSWEVLFSLKTKYTNIQWSCTKDQFYRRVLVVLTQTRWEHGISKCEHYCNRILSESGQVTVIHEAFRRHVQCSISKYKYRRERSRKDFSVLQGEWRHKMFSLNYRITNAYENQQAFEQLRELENSVHWTQPFRYRFIYISRPKIDVLLIEG